MTLELKEDNKGDYNNIYLLFITSIKNKCKLIKKILFYFKKI